MIPITGHAVVPFHGKPRASGDDPVYCIDHKAMKE